MMLVSSATPPSAPSAPATAATAIHFTGHPVLPFSSAICPLSDCRDALPSAVLPLSALSDSCLLPRGPYRTACPTSRWHFTHASGSFGRGRWLALPFSTGTG